MLFVPFGRQCHPAKHTRNFTLIGLCRVRRKNIFAKCFHVDVKLLVASAKQNDDQALMALSQIYFEGNEIAQPDPVKGEKCLRKAISLGSPLAKAVLADELKEGVHIEKDLPQAIQLLTESANEGFPPAMAELGDYYEFGIGVEKNLDRARELYKLALDDGFDMVQPAYDRVVGQQEKVGGLFGKIGSMVSSLFGKNAEQIGVEEGVVMVQQDDPEMEAAVQRAQSTLDEFIAGVTNPQPDTSYSLKVRMEENGEVEYIWLSNITFSESQFTGTIDNDPVFMKHVKLGDEHKAHPNDVNDWIIMGADGALQGGFTVELLQRRHAES